MHTKIKQIFKSASSHLETYKEGMSKLPFAADFFPKEYSVKGWVRTARIGKKISFVEIYDGTTVTGLQCVGFDKEMLKGITTGCSVEVKGDLVESQGSGQAVELQLKEVIILGECNETFPIQKKEHTMEFFREKAHLRTRTKLFHSIMKIRSVASQVIHKTMMDSDIHQFFTPILTSSDCEGAGETFELKDEEFFGKETHLTISGQIELEYGALSMGDVYTFSPTFRAENSHTSKHLSEFWMFERESAFLDMEEAYKEALALVQTIVLHVCELCKDEIAYLETQHGGIMEKLKPFYKIELEYGIISYEEAIEKLGLKWGDDIDSEKEKELVKMTEGRPVVLHSFPIEMKPFYMKESGDGKTVKGFDILLPDVGELVGGSEREDDYDVLAQKMTDAGLDLSEYSEYLDTRKYGSVQHSGYGIGFERLLMFITGTKNIRDVITFPRVPK